MHRSGERARVLLKVYVLERRLRLAEFYSSSIDFRRWTPSWSAPLRVASCACARGTDLLPVPRVCRVETVCVLGLHDSYALWALI